ncbi:MAG: hypothetical protein LBE56_12315 [Tannerella sp.]|jgi:hypothetical protein|nr:hypothetical protein [Tannerella sp.]
MEKKLELRDVAGYLPYGLHCLNCDDCIEEIDFCNVGNLIRGIELQDDAEDDEWVASQQYKPVLRPVSDLYKPIQHNGKEEIPIMECAEISIPGKKWRHSKFSKCAWSEDREIEFSTDDGEFYLYLNNQGKPSFIKNQYKVFDYLHSRFIDYRNLIDAGLAVSCYDIETNPYK